MRHRSVVVDSSPAVGSLPRVCGSAALRPRAPGPWAALVALLLACSSGEGGSSGQAVGTSAPASGGGGIGGARAGTPISAVGGTGSTLGAAGTTGASMATNGAGGAGPDAAAAAGGAGSDAAAADGGGPGAAATAGGGPSAAGSGGPSIAGSAPATAGNGAQSAAGGGGAASAGAGDEFVLMPVGFPMAGAELTFPESANPPTNASPEFTWTGVPPEARSLALAFRDLGNMAIKWIIWDIPPTITHLPPNISPVAMPPEVPASSQLGSLTNQGYAGPGSGARQYDFTLWALDIDELPVAPGQTTAQIHDDVMSLHVIAKTEPILVRNTRNQ